MDINQVRFGNYTIGNPNAGTKKSSAKQEKETTQTPVQEQNKTLNSNEVFDAMNLVGIQNKQQINFAPKKEINPLDYLSQDRINDIEAMMGNFDNGVNNIASTIEQEFPQMFSEAQKNSLAASIFARE